MQAEHVGQINGMLSKSTDLNFARGKQLWLIDVIQFGLKTTFQKTLSCASVLRSMSLSLRDLLLDDRRTERVLQARS